MLSAKSQERYGDRHSYKGTDYSAAGARRRSAKPSKMSEKPGNSALGQEHVEIRGRALPEMVGMCFKERACG
jgi:hypothetical protein